LGPALGQVLGQLQPLMKGRLAFIHPLEKLDAFCHWPYNKSGVSISAERSGVS